MKNDPVTHKAAGALFLAKETGRVMLNLRSKFTSNSNTWSFWGGMVHHDESVMQGLTRELEEELGPLPTIVKEFALDVFHSSDGKFNYYTMLLVVEKEFIPKLNRESNGYAWVRIGHWPKPLHEGAKKLLYNKQVKNNLYWAWKNSDYEKSSPDSVA